MAVKRNRGRSKRWATSVSREVKRYEAKNPEIKMAMEAMRHVRMAQHAQAPLIPIRLPFSAI